MHSGAERSPHTHTCSYRQQTDSQCEEATTERPSPQTAGLNHHRRRDSTVVIFSLLGSRPTLTCVRMSLISEPEETNKTEAPHCKTVTAALLGVISVISNKLTQRVVLVYESSCGSN